MEASGINTFETAYAEYADAAGQLGDVADSIDVLELYYSDAAGRARTTAVALRYSQYTQNPHAPP